MRFELRKIENRHPHKKINKKKKAVRMEIETAPLDMPIKVLEDQCINKYNISQNTFNQCIQQAKESICSAQYLDRLFK